MIGTSGGLLEIQALLILKSFAVHALPARAIGISRTFCDIVGMVPGGIIGVKLRRSLSQPLTTEQATRCYWPEITLMKSCCPQKPVRLELWIAFSGGRWQFFEIDGDNVREVTHA
ncbi:hypothetical protein [Methanoregula sp.]|jgi:hypothetical protein|uniref:hypothetical protein n=1 Tax=Methanoregula sp. TaxID=2052170 RepID=UPI0025CECC96|nr:hypothetical protein [Methanoregula sp.]